MAFFTRKSKAPAAVPASPVVVTLPTRPSAPSASEDRILELGAQMLTMARNHKAGLLSAKFYSDALMNWSMKDPNFKVQLFRFVDAFPMLKTPEDVFEHLKDYLSQPGVTVPAPIELALKAGGIAKGLAAGQISKQITGMASKFIAGTDAKSALSNLKSLWEDGIAFSVDLLGEACVSDEEADHYQGKYLDLINNLPDAVAAWKPNQRLETDHLGAIPRTNVSIKVSSLSARCDPIDTPGSLKDLISRLGPILEAAKKKGVFVNFDMEQYSLKDFTLELFMRCCEEHDFQAGLAMQAYLRSGESDAARICDWAVKKGRQVTVRLVKGAYWDYQIIHAEQMGWPVPVWTTKRETDACFERMTRIYLDATPREKGNGGVKLALGSHNVRSIAAALAGAEQRGLPHAAVELQMLHGMADQLKYAAAEMGLRIREYVPVGEMIPGMAYLVRRLLENTSNESWLKAGFLDNADPSQLLKSPHYEPDAQARNGLHTAPAPDKLRELSSPERHTLSPAVAGVGDSRAFINEPMRDFSDDAQRRAFAEAVTRARVPAVQNTTTPEQASQQVARAHAAFEGDAKTDGWRDADPLLRAKVLTRAAELMRTRRDELSAVMIKESGKTWREADADTCEAIDFCEYYARMAPQLFAPQRLGRFIGELDQTWYQPRGVAIVIAPWNFPLAILIGMATAALVTGNTVIMKPAEQTPGIAKLGFDILQQAMRDSAVPTDILQFCPAPGETTGAALVRDPRTALVAFTGSRDVGCDILTAAAPGSPFTNPDLRKSLTHVKRVVCEMGGKNAVIIDTSADFDEAVLAVRHSAFGFQGQKCSACSRVIVVDPEGPDGPAIRSFTHRLVEAAKALTIGDPAQPGTDVGPVIDEEAKKKIEWYIAKAKEEGCKLELAMPTPSGLPPRSYVPPHIFSHVTPNHSIAKEEIFGPVLAVMHASTFEAALDVANSSVYKLTGGVFSRKPAHLDLARRKFRVGNLYLNRGITGALVARQPFGGFAMSGVGSKAGGADYLLQFVEPRAACENTLRRGFAPEL
jgi:RHH-type transcriptional regulator, proline utilization regulon repressor / proline dehydrogenase / delta 1-pyrroline-5-carboxylate dehydrogenase